LKLYVCFLWHMHQPYYRDPETGTYILPWVRLHAIKDYVALPRIFRDSPGVRHTFNLVPSLLIQVIDYVERGAEDTFLAVSRRNALELTDDEERFLLRNFFSAFPPTMILPHPRYAELFHRREAALQAVGKSSAHKGFGATEYRDLMTLFNLTWFHPLHREEDKDLSRLWKKGRAYTEQDKNYVLDRQIALMASVLPEYKKMMEVDGGELSTTPMYHPILPLLVTSQAARDAHPDTPLPKTLFSYPADAQEQLRRGKGSFRSFFGIEPAGLWPSEGCISPAVLDLAVQADFAWTATDEILLARSLGRAIHRDSDGVPLEPDLLYTPYTASTKSGEIRIFFRDHHLSDLIGFEYPRWNSTDAVNNFAQKIGKIYERLSSLPRNDRKEAYVVTVILDGENAWEYYPDHGEPFLRMLMDRCGRMSPQVSFVPFSEALRHVDAPQLPSIPTGSWIDGTFGIWIGHPEDHAAWEALSRARNLFQLHSERFRRAGLPIPTHLGAAYEHLLVAEGSDWCWWYGEEHFTPHGPEFDRLFRHHIKAAYREMGETPPDALDIPILKPDRMPGGTRFLPSPRYYIHPRINGRVSSYFEWSAATRYIPSVESGAMHRAGHGIMLSLRYGFDESQIFLRVDFSPSALDELPVTVEVDVLFPVKNRKVSVLIHADRRTMQSFMGKIEDDLIAMNARAHPESLAAAFHKVLELGIPFRELGCENDERIEFFITISPEGSIGERWPMFGHFVAELPGPHFEERMWEV
jgi:alpha-amylase/alpha-mannosidase (GH57 family)